MCPRLYCLLNLLIIARWLDFCESVSLSVDGGVSLVGPHCPGTVRLVCEGTELPYVRWAYNYTQNVLDIQPDNDWAYENASPTPKTVNPAFLSVELTKFDLYFSNSLNRTVFNASTALTVNITELYEQKIVDITCNTVGININVSIKVPSRPPSPNITNVTVIYHSEMLNSVQVTWTKLLPQTCPEYALEYIVHSNGFGSKRFNNSVCEETVCTLFLEGYNGTFDDEELITLVAVNEHLQSEPETYHIYTSNYFFTSIVSFSSCDHYVECLSDLNFTEEVVCSVQYQATYSSQSLSTSTSLIMVNMNTPTVLLSPVTPNTFNLFEFSIWINDSLLVIERRSEMAISRRNELGAREIVKLCVVSSFTLLLILHIVCSVCLLKELKIDVFAARKKIMLCLILILTTLFLPCIIMLLAFISFISDQCILVNQHTLDICSMQLISSFGITFIIIIWISVGYSICQHRRAQKLEEPHAKIKRESQDNDLQHVHMNASHIGKEVEFQETTQRSFAESKYEHINLEEQMGAYDTLEHSLGHSVLMADSHTDETYSKIELDPEIGAVEPQCAYEQPAENMRGDYDVLGRDLGRASYQHSSIYNSFYDTLDRAAIESSMMESEVYEQLRPGDKSKAVQNMEYPNYSHVHVEDEQPEVAKKNVKLKSRVFKKTK